MTNDEGKPQDPLRFFEHHAGGQIAEMTLQVLRGSFAQRSWNNSDEAMRRFWAAQNIFEQHFQGKDIRFCFEEAASQLRLNMREADPWERAAAEGSRYHIQNLASHGHAYGHWEDRRAGFIAAVEEAIKSGRR